MVPTTRAAGWPRQARSVVVGASCEQSTKSEVFAKLRCSINVAEGQDDGLHCQSMFYKSANASSVLLSLQRCLMLAKKQTGSTTLLNVIMVVQEWVLGCWVGGGRRLLEVIPVEAQAS